jgi:hypothetical protein
MPSAGLRHCLNPERRQPHARGPPAHLERKPHCRDFGRLLPLETNRDKAPAYCAIRCTSSAKERVFLKDSNEREEQTAFAIEGRETNANARGMGSRSLPVRSPQAVNANVSATITYGSASLRVHAEALEL